MRGFALIVALLVLSSANVYAAPKCDSVDASIGYEKAVKSGETTTFFSPHMNVGGSDVARFAVLSSLDAVSVCKALGYNNGNLGDVEESGTSEILVTLNSHGEVGNIKRGCNGNDCRLAVVTITCW
jgi:hypothetical protein